MSVPPVMPSQKELRAAADAVQRLRTPPLPGPRQREELLARVAQVLRQLLRDQEQVVEHDEPSSNPEQDLADDPLLGQILER